MLKIKDKFPRINTNGTCFAKFLCQGKSSKLNEYLRDVNKDLVYQIKQLDIKLKKEDDSFYLFVSNLESYNCSKFTQELYKSIDELMQSLVDIYFYSNLTTNLKKQFQLDTPDLTETESESLENYYNLEFKRSYDEENFKNLQFEKKKNFEKLKQLEKKMNERHDHENDINFVDLSDNTIILEENISKLNSIINNLKRKRIDLESSKEDESFPSICLISDLEYENDTDLKVFNIKPTKSFGFGFHRKKTLDVQHIIEQHLAVYDKYFILIKKDYDYIKLDLEELESKQSNMKLYLRTCASSGNKIKRPFNLSYIKLDPKISNNITLESVLKEIKNLNNQKSSNNKLNRVHEIDLIIKNYSTNLKDLEIILSNSQSKRQLNQNEIKQLQNEKETGINNDSFKLSNEYDQVKETLIDLDGKINHENEMLREILRETAIKNHNKELVYERLESERIKFKVNIEENFDLLFEIELFEKHLKVLEKRFTFLKSNLDRIKNLLDCGKDCGNEQLLINELIELQKIKYF